MQGMRHGADAYNKRYEGAKLALFNCVDSKARVKTKKLKKHQKTSKNIKKTTKDNEFELKKRHPRSTSPFLSVKLC